MTLNVGISKQALELKSELKSDLKSDLTSELKLRGKFKGRWGRSHALQGLLSKSFFKASLIDISFKNMLQNLLSEE